MLVALMKKRINVIYFGVLGRQHMYPVSIVHTYIMDTCAKNST